MNRLLQAALLAAVSCTAAAQLHHTLDATLSVPFQGAADGSRTLLLQAEFPQAPGGTRVFWTVSVRSPEGTLVSEQQGEWPLSGSGKRDVLSLAWPPEGVSAARLASGFYTAELQATALEPWLLPRLGSAETGRVDRALELAPNGRVLQSWELQIGQPAKPLMPEFRGLTRAGTPAVLQPNGIPYTLYLGNLHSQTNHSDGGGNVATCTSSQGAQTGEFGPPAAFAFADQHGLDYLMVSEHNHYFDGSSGTASTASASAAISLYHSGLDAAQAYATLHPDFLPIYGMEWGVISDGGHLNVIGSSLLWGWEFNNQGQLFGEVFTPLRDYAAVYQQMQTSGTIGQFNHPDTTASGNQFLIGGVPNGYSAIGDEVMTAFEIINTSAFSNNTDEGETSQSSYETAFKRALERGFHVAPTTNQDNHCANWGASAPNRTGVLIPNGVALTEAAMMEALRARRVFATGDKNSEIVFEANGHLMGERFANTGPLALTVSHASSTGQTVAQVQIFEGVPQRNGTVTVLIAAATTTVTPTAGEHFYYAKITQSNGKILYSAPIWVTQNAAVGTPVITSTAPSAATEDMLYTYNATRDDPDGPTQIWSLLGTHTCDGSVVAASGVFSFTPAGPVPAASCVLALQVCDGGTPNLCASQTSNVSITAVNDAPAINSSAPASATPGSLYVYSATRTDPDGPGQLWSLLAGHTCGGSMVASSGQFSFTPSTSNPPASCVISLQVCDTAAVSLCASQDSTITILGDAIFANRFE